MKKRAKQEKAHTNQWQLRRKYANQQHARLTTLLLSIAFQLNCTVEQVAPCDRLAIEITVREQRQCLLSPAGDLHCFPHLSSDAASLGSGDDA